MGIAAYTVCAAVSIPFWNRLTRKHDKRKLLLIANCLVAALLFWLGIGAQNVTRELFLAGCGVMGIVFAAYQFIPYSFVPDLVEFYEHKTGERHESVFFGLWITVHQWRKLLRIYLKLSMNQSSVMPHMDLDPIGTVIKQSEK